VIVPAAGQEIPVMIDIDAKVKEAMKAKDPVMLTAYRSLKAKVMVKLNEAGRGGKPLSEEEIAAAAKREVRERQEANEFLKPGNTTYEENTRIISLLEALLPKMLSAEDLDALVKKVISETGAQGAKDMGKVMGGLKKSGAPIDMGAASAKVKALLGA
jgi:hypothetical protein